MIHSIKTLYTSYLIKVQEEDPAEHQPMDGASNSVGFIIFLLHLTNKHSTFIS